MAINPHFLSEWDYEKNIGLHPSMFSMHSNKSVWWKCELGHSWKTSISHRAYGTRCPHCFKEHGTSFAEQAIVFYLSKYCEVTNRHKYFGKEIDIFLPKYNIGFEYDGMFFHKGKKSEVKEARKNQLLEENGISLFRIIFVVKL